MGLLLALSGWIVLALVGVAPWALGCQPVWAGQGMVGGVALAVLFRVVGRRAPSVPVAAVILALALIAVGWAALAHAPRVAVETHTPQSELIATVRAESLFVTAMLLVGLLAADLGRDPLWRRRALRTLAYTAAAVALVGTVGHLAHANPYARFMSDKEGEAPFGPFNYHGNAGAFLNLALPLAIFACGDGVAAAVVTVVLLIGIAVNASKAAQAVAALEFIACAVVWWRMRAARPTGRRIPRSVVVGLAVIGIAVVAVGARQAAHRWSRLSSAVQRDSSRSILWRVCWHMAEAAGWQGDGPGSFKLLFALSPQMDPALYSHFIVTDYHPGQQVSMWSHVHDDYLQTLIEWGWPGTALWLALFAGGLAVVSRGGDRRRSAAVLIALAGVLLHALVDFPLQVEVIRLDVAVLLGLAWSTPRAAEAGQAGV